MLELKDIVKIYGKDEFAVKALDGVSIKFRENEFVSILGASGCGKTTMLNIIGGLDRYTSGDLIINGKSTKLFKDADWDTYRNHSIGFVFQSYNLIPHQSVLSNVELALTLSGVSPAERKARAIEALKKVGLGDQLKKRPNQLSGGQMQRVAIARSLVNDPDILLADEPTGALDTHTSVQIMDILKEVAKEKLVIMVTHNPELAETYSTRIIRVSDGQVINDTDPFEDEGVAAVEETVQEQCETEKVKKSKKVKKSNKKKKRSMSFATALSLSINNLMTKKGRTALTSFAGSIGIIGIALILALSNGIQGYIDQVQEDTLSTYPLSITESTQDYTAMLTAMTAVSDAQEDMDDPNKIYVDDSLGTMMSAMSATVKNDLVSFKKYIEDNYSDIESAISDIQYTYDFDLQVFTNDGKTQVNPTQIFDSMGSAFSGMGELMEASNMGSLGVMSEMIDNQALLDQQYELVGENSHWPENENEVILVVGKNNQISKMALYMLGVLDQSEIEEIMTALMTDGKYDAEPIEPYDLDDFIGMKFRLLNTSDFYEKTNKTYGEDYPVWNDVRDDIGFDQEAFVSEHGTELVISGIVRPRDGVAATSIGGSIGYTKALTDKILELNAESEVINQQKETPDYNVLTGLKFERTHYTPENIHELVNKIDGATMEQFYVFMTQQILTSPELADRINVNGENFAMMFMMMPADMQAGVLEGILASANAQNPDGVKALFTAISAMTNGIEVNANNFIRLLPVLDMKIVGACIVGIPETEYMGMTIPPIPGLVTLAGEPTMNAIYTQMTESFKTMTVTEEIFLAILSTMTAEDEEFKMIEDALYNIAPQTDATLESTLKLLGDAEEAAPASINFYAKDFASKDIIETFIKDYNASREKVQQIQYTDIVGVMMSSVSIIIDVISYVLIAFVSISLVVSSIMIGIITYISVLERTKEIGILRSIGASKKDVSRVFNAETVIIGFCAGFIGILFTVLLTIPINSIIYSLSGVAVKASLPVVAAIALVLISMMLTVVAGLVPARIAAKKDPVEALRTE